MRRPAAVALLLLTLTTTACARPWSARPELDTRARRETGALLQRVRLYDDPALSDYLATLSARPDGGARIHVVRDPALAIFSTPEGELFVHTGVLAVAESEDQLAAILAHEQQHVLRDDAFEAGEAAPIVPLVRPGITSRTAIAIYGLDLPLTARAAITGYGAQRERDADAAALDVLAAAGRGPGAALTMYEALAAQARRGGEREVFHFGDTKALEARLVAVRDLLTARSPAAGRSAARPDPTAFERRLRRARLENASEEIRQGRFDLARSQLAGVTAAAPGEPRLHFYEGELHRLEAQRATTAAEREVDLVQARTAYERALTLDPALAEAHRQLGLLYFAMRDPVRARAELERYLALAPSAPDHARIEEYVQELGR